MELEELDKDDGAIYTLFCDCETLFEAAISQGPSCTFLALYEDYQQRFSTWAAYLGVFARPSQCLDYRLRNTPDIVDLVLRTLDSLKRSLLSITQRMAPSKFGNDKEQQHFLQNDKITLLEVDESLGRLGRLAVTIRKSAQFSLEHRAKEFAQKQNFRSVDELIYLHIQNLYPEIPCPLKDLLSKSMSDKYAKIMFLQTRQADLSTRHERRGQLSIIHEERQEDAEVSAETIPGLARPEVVGSSRHTAQMTNPSLTPLSSINTRALRSYQADRAGSSSKKTFSILINQGSYPRAPDKRRHELMLCEWCAEPLTTSDLEPSRWIRHIDHDLKPYVCLVEGCDESIGYATFREWSTHMQQHDHSWHRKIYQSSTWPCPLCAKGGGHFTSADDLFRHMTDTHHPTIFNEAQLHTIADQSQMPKYRPEYECLLCGFLINEENTPVTVPVKRDSQLGSDVTNKKVKIEDQLTFSRLETPEDPTEFQQVTGMHDSIARHIASHLQTLMGLLIRIVLMHRDVGSGQENESVNSATDTIDLEDYEKQRDFLSVMPFEDISLRQKSAWIPDVAVHNTECLQGTVHIYPTLDYDDLVDSYLSDTSIPDSSAIDDIILRLETLYTTVKQHRDFYTSSIAFIASRPILSPMPMPSPKPTPSPEPVHSYTFSVRTSKRGGRVSMWRCGFCFFDNTFYNGTICMSCQRGFVA